MSSYFRLNTQHKHSNELSETIISFVKLKPGSARSLGVPRVYMNPWDGPSDGCGQMKPCVMKHHPGTALKYRPGNDSSEGGLLVYKL